MQAKIFDRLSFLSLFLVIILLPIFFLPFTKIPVEISKGLLLVVGLVLCIVFWAIARFIDGKIVLPKSWLLLSGAGVVLVFLLSALFSGNPKVSLFGIMLDVGSFWFIFSGFVLMLMSAIIIRTPQKAKIILFGIILSSAAMFIFQAIRFYLPGELSLGILQNKTDNILGAWNAFGIFAGFSALMSLLVVEFFSTTKVEKLILQALTILAIAIIAAVNFLFVWKLLGIFALIIFVYKVSITSKERVERGAESAEGPRADLRGGAETHFPVFSFIIILITLLFFMSGNVIGNILPNRLNLQRPIDVVPSFSTTMAVAKSVLKENPVFGMGPNKFAAAWALYRPAEFNQTPFWNVSFNSGSGLLPTFAATTGALGILSLLVFVILFTATGIKSIFSSIKSGENWETMAFFTLSFYLFASLFFYPGGTALFLLSLAFSGIFIGLASSRPRGVITISYLDDHRKSFFSILFIVIVIISAAAISFKYGERLISVAYFDKAVKNANQDISSAEAAISKALTLYENDLYLRTYAEIYFLKLNTLVQKGESISDAEKQSLQATLDQVVSGAMFAAKYDSTNFANFQALGSLYQGLALLGVKDSYSKSAESYKTAISLNPTSPFLKLTLASVLFADGKTEEAKDYANQTLALKPDYVDALLILSQIAKSEDDNAGALSYAQKALSISPLNADLIKYVESLKTPVSAPDPEPAPAPNTKKKS